MTIAELLYRIKQLANNFIEKVYYTVPAYKSVIINNNFILRLDEFAIGQELNITKYQFFDTEVDITVPINFHYDISTGKTFPMSYSKRINIRSDECGNAKLVWEINRLQFLLPVAIAYQKTRNRILLSRFMAIMKDWNEQNPYLKGINWYSNIEVNLRLINWYWCWLVLNSCDELTFDNDFNDFKNQIWLPLIYTHCYYSYKNPSFHSSANNHLISEYSGLFIASSLWKFKDSDKWLNYAKDGLEKEIVKQHSNGINKEEAAEYIQFITDLFLLPFIAGQHQGIDFSKNYEIILGDIASYIYNFLDVKGNFPKYGDEDDGKILVPDGDAAANNFFSILNTIAILLNKPDLKHNNSSWDLKSSLLTAHKNGYNNWKIIKPGHILNKSKFYKEEGHFIFRKNESDSGEIYLHFDASPLGYLSIAAHGHADALSIILHVNGHPFLIDSGTYTYHTEKEWRKYFVSTKAHNTISVDDLNQAQHAGPTLWLNHFKVTVEECVQIDNIEYVKASHDGYAYIDFNHTRQVEFDREKKLFTITDTVSQKNDHEINIYWHLHPFITVIRNEHIFSLTGPNNQRVLMTVDDQLVYQIVEGSIDPILGWYSSSFLKKQPTKVIKGHLKTNNIKNITFKTLILIN